MLHRPSRAQHPLAALEFAGGAFAAVTVLGTSWYYCSDTAARALLAVLVVLAVPVVYAATTPGTRTVTERPVRDALVTVVDADPDNGTPSKRLAPVDRCPRRVGRLGRPAISRPIWPVPTPSSVRISMCPWQEPADPAPPQL